MSMPAFYLDAPFAAGQTIILDGAEAAHARVLRIAGEDMAELFDGHGGVAVCRVEKVEKRSLALCIEQVRHTPRPRSLAIVALALSKAVRRGFFLEKAAELGAAEVWLWQSARSVGRPGPGTLASCRAQLASGGKQSRNPWFPVLRDVVNLDGLLLAVAEAGIDWRILPWEDQDRHAMLALDQVGRPGLSIYVIGPEGGFTPEEVERFQKENFAPVSLGRQVLRCETAATLCLGLHAWASQLPGRPGARTLP